MGKFATNVSSAMLLPSSIQVTESISGSVVPLAMFLQSGGVEFILAAVGFPKALRNYFRYNGESSL